MFKTVPHVMVLCLWVVPFDLARGAEYRVVRAFDVAAEPACMPAVTLAPNGDILVAFSTEWEPVPAGGVLKLVVSRDGGDTWSKPRTLWKHEDPLVTIQVSCGMQTLSNGAVLLPVNCGRWPRRKGAKGDSADLNATWDIRTDNPEYRREVALLRSRDSGKTWSIEDPGLWKSWPRYGRLLETRDGSLGDGRLDGRLIMTGYGWYVESRDHGKTWGKIQWIEDGIKSEMNMAQAADGALFTMHRGAGHPPRRTFGTRRSNDGGKTWGPMKSLRSFHVQGKMPDFLVLPSGRILMVAGAVGLTDGSQIGKLMDRFSFCSLFISDDHGATWKRDVDFAQVIPSGSIVPADQPGLCRLDDGRILVVLQGMDRSKKGDPWFGFHTGMSVIGNVIEPQPQ